MTRYIPDLAGSGYDGVTVAQLMTMTSGVKWNEDYTDPKSDVARMFLEPVPAGIDPTVYFMRKLPRETAPGTKWVYKTGETNLIGVLVRRATGKTLAAYAEEKIWKPAGMERDGFWMKDQSGAEVSGCCLSVSLRDYARFGQFALEGGMAWSRRAGSPTPPALMPRSRRAAMVMAINGGPIPRAAMAHRNFRPDDHDRSGVEAGDCNGERRAQGERSPADAAAAGVLREVDGGGEVAGTYAPPACGRRGRLVDSLEMACFEIVDDQRHQPIRHNLRCLHRSGVLARISALAHLGAGRARVDDRGADAADMLHLVTIGADEDLEGGLGRTVQAPIRRAASGRHSR